MGRIKLILWSLIILLSAVACHSKEELPPPDDLMYFGEYKEFLLDGVIDELKQRDIVCVFKDFQGNIFSREATFEEKDREAPGMAGCHADGETLFPDSRLNQLFIEEGTAWDDWNESLPVIIDWGSYFDAAEKSDKGSYGSFDFNSIWDIKSDINGGYPYLRNNP